MADYPVSIEKVRNVLVELRDSVADPYIRTGADMAIAKLEGFTPMDAVPVVRCRECKHYHVVCEATKLPDAVCLNKYGMSDRFLDPDGYCASGERKEDDHAAD